MKMNKINGVISSTIVFGLLMLPTLTNAQQSGAEFSHKVQPPPKVAYHNYANLTDLLTILCDEADKKFKNFYGAGVIEVQPFITIGEFQRNKISELGATLADQMIAEINNNTITTKAPEKNAVPQRLNGVIQEVDGYLRIHIFGVNSRGQRASYVTNVEMSEPIYRALHTFI